MEKLISKLQYKTCEKGEYYDEQLRCLEETIALIKGYPWYREQYADIDITGPSITIQDNKGNFLKVSIYYGGRLTLYYLFDNVLYTRFNLGYEEVIPAVENLFLGNLGLDGFNKTLYNVGKKSYFVTKDFTYRITLPKILIRLHVFLTLIILAGIGIIVLLKNPATALIIPLILILPVAWIFIWITSSIYKKRKQFLQISRGNNTFTFCDENGITKEFNKADIVKFIHYVSTNSRSPIDVEFVEFRFTDESTILFSNALISVSELENKFTKHWKLEPSIEKVHIIKMF